MFRNRLYYRIKPLLPWSVRMGVRRWLARRKLGQATESWPILPGSERPPRNWSGWPGGKQFAFVLTHDVKSPAGLARCRRLMELEQKRGFRSCFNLVPRGRYEVTPSFREELPRRGFELGVHDLYHNGRLFATRNTFHRHAGEINRYLKDWGAVGFRSAYMLRRLEWIHDLEVLYDSSTFDTDPFEPQPQGQNTIFPFWVPGAGAGPGSPRAAGLPTGAPGYVELPYTLPQDSTLFLVLGERSPELWQRKLDWIAQHGGMALVNIHPDYVRFAEESAAGRTYPVAWYEQLLAYVAERFAGAYWQPLPRELAAYVARVQPQPARRPLRVCMATYSVYTNDARVTRYAETLAERGDEVDVLALSNSPTEPVHEQVAKVNLFRLQRRLGKREKTPWSFLVPVLRFCLAASAWIARQHARAPYDVLHIHNIPDFLVLAALWPKLRGAKVILDIHDLVPEFYASKFGVSERAWLIRALRGMEWMCARVADRVIIANDLWLQKYAARTGSQDKCAAFINNVDARIFGARPRTRTDAKPIVIFPGGLQWHQGLDLAIRAFQQVARELPEAEFHIYGDGNMKEKLVALTQELGLTQRVLFFAPRPVRQIAQLMADADLGVVPKRADSFGNEAYSTKIMEFMSLRVPVVVSRTKIDQFYFNDSVVRFFESGNVDALAQAMLEVLREPELRRRLVGHAAAYAAEHSWDSRRHDYLRLVDGLRPKPEPAVAFKPAPASAVVQT